VALSWAYPRYGYRRIRRALAKVRVDGELQAGAAHPSVRGAQSAAQAEESPTVRRVHRPTHPSRASTACMDLGFHF